MVEYKIIFSKLADKGKKLPKQTSFENKAKELLNLIAINPYQTPPTYGKLNYNIFLEINLSGNCQICIPMVLF